MKTDITINPKDRMFPAFLSALAKQKDVRFLLYCYPGVLTGHIRHRNDPKQILTLTDGNEDYSVFYEQLWCVEVCGKLVEINPCEEVTAEELREMINEWWEYEHGE